MHSFVLALVLVLAVGASHAAEEEVAAAAAPDAAVEAADALPAPETADTAVEPAAETVGAVAVVESDAEAAVADPAPEAAPPPPVEPVASVEPVEAVEPVASVEPVEAVEPVASVEPVEAVEPVASVEPVEAVEPVASVEPVEAVEPVASVEPVEAVEPVASVEPVEAVEPVTTAAPAFDPHGTIHVVRKGDTLWDISNLYLGTPWIWPSLWRDNGEIENPHLIRPGDKIWVSATEMRKVSDAEAAALQQAAARAEAAPEPALQAPAAPSEDAPVTPERAPTREVLEYWRMGSLGVVSEEELESYGRVVGTVEEQVLLTQGDVVFVDRGEGEVEPGDRFTMLRTGRKVWDPATRRPLGVHSEVVGWLEIVQVHGPTSRARIRQAYADFVPGAYLRRRDEEPAVAVEVYESPPGVEGQIADLLVDPKYHGSGDVVVLNRGAEDGLERGSPLEVYRPVDRHWKETWYGKKPDVEIPHEVVAELVVLSVERDAAMAYVRRATTEIWYGDHFRTMGGPSVDLDDLDDRPWTAAMKRVARSIPTPDVEVPSLDMPDAFSDWNLPRLPLPSLDGYDPR